MFTAKMKDGTVISLLNGWDKSKLESYIHNEPLFCPVCGSIVLPKLGSCRLWHFAHAAKKGCLNSIENESYYHMSGKKNLYEWFKRQGYKVEIEVYIPEIKQRPDLLVYVENKRYAIEYQCSTIDTELLLKRTRCYQKAKIIPLWIVGGNRLKRNTNHTITLSSFDLLMALAIENKDICMIYYCPSTNRFLQASLLVPFSTSKFLAKIHFYKPTQFSFPMMLKSINNINPDYYDDWLFMKERWRKKSYVYTSDFYKRLFYEQGVPLCLLPAEAGIPTKSLIWIKTDAILWQGWIIMNFIVPIKEGLPFTFHDVYDRFRTEIEKGIFKIRKLPTMEKSHYSFAVMEYLLQLVKAGLLCKSGNPPVFRKIHAIVLPKNIEEACDLDREIVNRLKQ
ncbi:competence protein CoiA [Calidifontibacillus oryziterrae]|uniref:competence protein CoiA n=1 Tax=Calidifontibacillus oryziterrae TaxID=1191699 RepID=UPI0002F9EDC5|nr:competence protein CoiA family protein [Calidifontibacillus oryziterrae]